MDSTKLWDHVVRWSPHIAMLVMLFVWQRLPWYGRCYALLAVWAVQVWSSELRHRKKVSGLSSKIDALETEIGELRRGEGRAKDLEHGAAR